MAVWSGLARTLHRWELFEHYEQSLQADFDDALKRLDRCVYSGVGPQGFSQFVAKARRLGKSNQKLPSHANRVSSRPLTCY